MVYKGAMIDRITSSNCILIALDNNAVPDGQPGDAVVALALQHKATRYTKSHDILY